nr:GNAT family N-acetyltransferase [Jeotgalibacillus sp. R-1-5s-1]
MISFKIDRNHFDIHRLVVSPDHFRKGIASQLLAEIEHHDKSHTLCVSTAEKNEPAIHFYKRNGFDIAGQTVIDERLTLIHFMKTRETEGI